MRARRPIRTGLRRPRRPNVPVLLFASAAAACTMAADEEALQPDAPARLDSFAFTDLGGAPLQWEAATGRLTAPGQPEQPDALFVHVFQADCGKCAELARALDALAAGNPEVAAAGIAHRLGEQPTRAFARRTALDYPVAVGTESDWAKQWGRGDPLYVVGADGRIAYRQTGFREEDVARWRAVAEDLIAGRPARYAGARREDLAAGDPLPLIELPDLLTGRPMSLATTPEGLEFRDASGRAHRYRASLGFFSRY